MDNRDIIKKFLEGATKGHTKRRNIPNGYYMYKGSTLEIDGDQLFNYNTVIAKRLEGGAIELNAKHYSSTTSRIQGAIRYLASAKGLEVIERE